MRPAGHKNPGKVILDCEVLPLLEPTTTNHIPGDSETLREPFYSPPLPLPPPPVTSINHLRCKALFPGKCERSKHTHTSRRHVTPPHQEMEKTAAQFIEGLGGGGFGWGGGGRRSLLGIWLSGQMTAYLVSSAIKHLSVGAASLALIDGQPPRSLAAAPPTLPHRAGKLQPAADGVTISA